MIDSFLGLIELLYVTQLPAMPKQPLTRDEEIRRIREAISGATGAHKKHLIARLGGLSGAGSLAKRVASINNGRLGGRPSTK